MPGDRPIHLATLPRVRGFFVEVACGSGLLDQDRTTLDHADVTCRTCRRTRAFTAPPEPTMPENVTETTRATMHPSALVAWLAEAIIPIPTEGRVAVLCLRDPDSGCAWLFGDPTPVGVEDSLLCMFGEDDYPADAEAEVVLGTMAQADMDALGEWEG
jgi:hypothetical protein